MTEYPILPTPASGTTPAVPGKASRHNDYLLVGGEARAWKFVARYNVSAGVYRDVDITEWMHVPGLQLNVNDNLQILAEYAYWIQQKTGGGTKRFDNTLAVTVHGYF